MIVNYKKFNPNGFQLLRYVRDSMIRYIFMFGGSSSGKSYACAQIILLLTLEDGQNTFVLRKVAASIEKSIYEDFKVAAATLGITHLFKFQDGIKRIKCIVNGAKIDFGGLDDPEKIKGISNYMRVQLEELSEFEEEDFKQMRKRLRGKKGQKIIATFNPIKETHWIKKKIFDAEPFHEVSMEISISNAKLPLRLTTVKRVLMNEPKEIMNARTKEIETHPSDTVIIQSTYLHNFWVVGSPCGTYGYYDDMVIADMERDRINDPDYYNVYALGEWGVIRTGSEFFASFNRGKHCAKCEYNPELPIHVSIDNNRLPYIAITLWQVDMSSGIHLRQIGECPAGNPDNTARKSAILLANRLREMKYDGKVYLHGDATTRNGNTIDDEGRSFLDLFISSLQSEGFEVVDCIGNKNPSVSMSGEFINAVWDDMLHKAEDRILPDLAITIDEDCRVSIEDYMSVQKDANGAILKTKVKNKITMQTYEEHGHISDTFRYVVCDLMSDAFLKFSNKRKRNLYARDGFIHFYIPEVDIKYSDDVVYCMPNIGGKFVMVHGSHIADKWHVREVGFVDTTSTEDIKSRLLAINCENTIIECADAYFPLVRELREADLSIRVMREVADVDRRIAATSDYVRQSILFNEVKSSDDEEYSAFMTSLLDYNADGKNKEASAVLSGFIQYVEKSFSN